MAQGFIINALGVVGINFIIENGSKFARKKCWKLLNCLFYRARVELNAAFKNKNKKICVFYD